jgi:hypothetical protein
MGLEVADGLETNMPNSKRGQIISRFLSPAVKLWLRSQLDHVEDLEFAINAGNLQLLSGSIQQITVTAQKAIYQGLHLSYVQLTATQIQTNLRQVLRGKPLQLLQPFPVVGEIQLLEADLNASLRSPLLAPVIKDFLLMLLAEDSGSDLTAMNWQLNQPQASLGEGQITLSALLIGENGKETSVAIRIGLTVERGHCLILQNPQWLPHANATRGLPLKELDGYQFDLGEQVQLQALTLQPAAIVCQGQIWVTPATNEA